MQPTNNGSTNQLAHLAPLQMLLNGMTADSLFVGGSLVVWSLLVQSWGVLAVGLFTVLAVRLFRFQVERLLRQQKIQQSVEAVIIMLLVSFTLLLVLVGGRLIVPLIALQSILPPLLGVLYNLPRRRLYIVAGMGLYVLMIISLIAPFPTQLVLNDLGRLIVLIDVLFLGISSIWKICRVVRKIFLEQATGSRQQEDLRRVLESDLKFRNAQLVLVAKASDEANMAKMQFLQHMSHELRSPLNSVIGLSEIIAEDLEAFPPEMVKEQARQIYKAGQHLLSVISDVLDIAKIESGTLQVYYEPIDLLTIIEDLEALIAGLRSRWPEIEFTMELPDALPVILAEDRRIRQILINLLDNAFKYTKQGKVDMRVYTDDEGILITVRDNGMGIAKENHALIFEPFEQVAGQKSVGTGLGLAITRHLVIEHGGTLTVESEPGHGSKFTVFLPKAEITFGEKRSGIVLLVDHDKNVHTVIKHLLSRAGYEPIAITAPDEARVILREQEVRLVLLDLHLPNEDIGWHFLQELVDSTQIPIVVYSSVQDTARVVNLGAVYLEKPARPSVLIDTIDTTILETTLAVQWK
ncbi:MAG: hybrid sensor histidine kinase/response regulator [Chloroflexota bacterium]